MKKCPKCEKAYEDTVTLCPNDGTVLEKASDALVGQILADKYRVDQFLSHGGMGTVYKGTHILMDKTVAIKVLHPSLAADDKIVARFSREARAASRISHPHALNVTDFGESQNGVVFLVMEYLHGKTLKEVIHAEGPMPLPRVIEIIRQVSGALDAAHGEGVVHRDLKSDNIMLIDVGGGDWAKVLDFGIAKIKEPLGGTDSALTSPNLIIGTPQYMSPEQCSQAAELDARSDIYSLGVILYELLVGRVPFTGESPTAIMMKHLQEPAPSVLDERKDVPAAVGRVVSRAMAKRPEDRYQSAGALSEALSLAAEDEAPVTAAAAAITGENDADRATNRIVVPTDSNELVRDTGDVEYDESTVVRAREEEEVIGGEEAVYRDGPPPAEAFNPWRIIVPAVVGLILVFGVIYALTRNSSQPTTNQQTQPLVVDPNSSNVQPMQSPTGQGERGIAGSSTTSSTSANSNSGSGQNQSSNGAPSGENSNSKRGDAPKNNNAKTPPGEATEPTPTEDNGTDEPSASPSPEPSESPEDSDEPPPPPKPKRRQRELPKPNLPTETPSQPPSVGDAPPAP
ncbi:MAG TPA: serine/threonine-protein kinase [Pyrinomonadaceae bacterium]|jgi:serine/threonine-protein kinase|nr:serine/threonine-protein kinase [Pyrinomonadaceae bacterium]